MAAWVRWRDRGADLAILPYQKAPAPRISDELRRACRQALHVVTRDGRVLRGGRAALFALSRVGWTKTARLFQHRPLLWLAELGYWLVSHYRSLLARFMFKREHPIVARDVQIPPM